MPCFRLWLVRDVGTVEYKEEENRGAYILLEKNHNTQITVRAICVSKTNWYAPSDVAVRKAKQLPKPDVKVTLRRIRKPPHKRRMLNSNERPMAKLLQQLFVTMDSVGDDHAVMEADKLSRIELLKALDAVDVTRVLDKFTVPGSPTSSFLTRFTCDKRGVVSKPDLLDLMDDNESGEIELNEFIDVCMCRKPLPEEMVQMTVKMSSEGNSHLEYPW